MSDPALLSIPPGLDAAGKTTILYKLHIGEVLSTVPTIGKHCGVLELWSLEACVLDRTKFGVLKRGSRGFG